MKIHSDKITAAHMYDAAHKAGVDFERMDQKGSRSKARAFDFLLTGSSNRRPNSGHRGATGDVYAATWDEWGMFLAYLFDVDPDAKATYYDNAEDFHWQTAARFHALIPSQQCRDHNWKFQGRAATGSYAVYECPKCEAIKRHKATW